jgi:MATE family multidrug resistance protein
MVNNLAFAGMAFADTVMAGQLGARALAGLSIGNAYFQLFIFAGFGILMALSPSVAHAHGAGDVSAVVRYARQSWWLVLVMSCVMVFGLWQVDWILPLLGVAPDIVDPASDFVHALSFGLPGALGFFALRYVSEGMGRTRPIMFIGCAALLFNIVGNWVLIYGKFGLPALGATGCAVSTALGYWLEFFALLWVMHCGRDCRPLRLFVAFDPPNWRLLRELLYLGMPIAGSLLSEGGLFVAAAFLMGGMGATVAAAHQIALNYATFTFMIPMAIGGATTIYVGQLLGSGKPAQARFAGTVGICCCTGVMLLAAGSMMLFNEQIAALYTRDVQVQALAATLLLVAALFQGFDGLQVGASGALRGFKDTALPMVFCVLSYWAVGFTLAYIAGVRWQLGPAYVWYGLTAGLVTASAALLARYRYISRRVALQPVLQAQLAGFPAAAANPEA